ncbi:MAG: YidC/Oxa1 family membrane protein insertase [Clostridia bacterium]
MDFAILAPTSNFILKPLAFVLSMIISVVYQLIQMITVDHSLGITIILFTFIVRACMLPLMLKQQRSSRKMMRLQPKIQKIQDRV